MLSKLKEVLFFQIEIFLLSNLVSKKLVSHHFILTAKKKKAEQTKNQQCFLAISEKLGHRANLSLKLDRWLQRIIIYGSINPRIGFPGDPVVRNLLTNAGDIGSITGWGRSPGEGNSNPL